MVPRPVTPTETDPSLQARSEQVDRIVQRLYRQFLGDTEGSLALIATGGYGRREMYPMSDVDLLVLSESPLSPALAPRVSAFLASLWTFALEPASSVRTLAEAQADAASDLHFYTALLEARGLAGDPVLLTRLGSALPQLPGRDPLAYFRAKRLERQQRHHRHADTAYNLEPNVKEGPGGLRDWHTLCWMTRRAFATDGIDGLRSLGLIERSEAQRLAPALAWLARMRVALHRLSGRKEDRVVFDVQPRLAEALGIDGGHPVETLMQRYFRAAATVKTICQRAEGRLAVRLGDSATVTRRIDDALLIRDGDIELVALADGEGRNLLPLSEAPRLAMDAAMALTEAADGKGFGQLLARHLERGLARLPAGAWRTPEMARRLVELLAARRGQERALRALAEAGVLAQMLPAFEQVTGRMQYDLFHVYTVDEHTLRLLGRLEVLRDESLAELPRARETFERLRQPELLFLAGLFHDIAKGRGVDHSLAGAEELRQFGAIAGLKPGETDLVAWLVEQHLAMSSLSQKKDIADPEVVRGFARLVGDRARLDHLYLLTAADIHATNPKLWTGWKARLLNDLYTDTRYWLRRGFEQPLHADERTEATRAEATALLRGEGVLLKQIARIWAQMPARSFTRYRPEEIRWQTQALLAHEGQSGPLVAVRPIGGAGYQVFVHDVDRDGLFATLACALERAAVSIYGARIHTAHGHCFDTFAVQDAVPAAGQGTRERAIEIQMALELALAESPLKPRPLRHPPTRAQRQFPFHPRIECEPLGGDEGEAQVSLVCSDRPGILSRAALAIREQGLSVTSARIATFGERVEDFFVVRYPDGRQVDADAAGRLVEAVRQRLSDLG